MIVIVQYRVGQSVCGGVEVEVEVEVVYEYEMIVIGVVGGCSLVIVTLLLLDKTRKQSKKYKYS